MAQGQILLNLRLHPGFYVALNNGGQQLRRGTRERRGNHAGANQGHQHHRQTRKTPHQTLFGPPHGKSQQHCRGNRIYYNR